MAKRITRKDIRQPDQFVTFSRRIYGLLLEEYRTQSIIAAGSLLAVVLAVWGWTVYSDSQNRLVAEGYSRAVALYHGRRYPEALQAFAQLARDHRSSIYGRFAQLYQADIYIAQKQPALADSVLQDLLNREKDYFVRQLAFVSLADSQEAQGQWQQAAKNFGEAEKLQGPFKEEALLGKARCSFQGGDLKEALSSYRQYLSSYPQSDRSAEVALRIQELEAKLNEKPLVK